MSSYLLLFPLPHISPSIPCPKVERVKQRRVVISQRYDCSKYDYPDTSWEFYDTWLGCPVNKLAIANGEVSTADEETMTKYINEVSSPP
jgi:hypothetical protein